MRNELRNGHLLNPIIDEVEEKIRPVHQEIDKIVETNQYRVLKSFQKNQVSDSHFMPSTGYGYGDIGRDTLEQVYADFFGTDAALVRPQIVSGTHAISTSLFGVLRPGEELIYITGKPYDTLEEVIGVRGNGSGSLKDYNISYQAIPLTNAGKPDYEKIRQAINANTKVIGIQRSKGYDTRPSYTISEIEEMIKFVKEIKEDVIVFVDNCYGEFVELKEPTHVGADLMAGSLIKNPGGGIAKTGGYIVGKQALIDQCANRLTAPGLGAESGASLDTLLDMYQGFFLAPHVVGQALKGAVFTSCILEHLGMNTDPHWQAKRTDLIQSVQFEDKNRMIAFCQAIQYASPVNSQFTPYPSEMPGYEDDVIMAGGTFIQGSSIELSADGPIRPPYVAYIQGGLTYEHVKIAICTALDELIEKNLIMIKQNI